MQVVYGLKWSIIFAASSIFPLEFHLLRTHRILRVISWFFQIFACPYLGASHFDRPSIFWKQFNMDMVLRYSIKYLK